MVDELAARTGTDPGGVQAIPDDVMRDRVLAAFEGWHLPIGAFVSTTAQIMRTAIYDVLSLPTWNVGRVMLLGDAAHAMSPPADKVPRWRSRTRCSWANSSRTGVAR
jgi:salicylate hydroxylase